MYGIVNQAIYGLVTENFGIKQWEKIKERSGVNVDYFISNEPYDDEITFDLVAAASEVLDLPASDILKAFGEYWILKTGYEKYGDLMKAGGKDLYEFICNLPNFHGRIMLIYPNLNPPEFAVEKVGEDQLKMHYYSTRNGLTDFVFGLMSGLAKMFDQQMEIELIEHHHERVWHDVFLIKITR